MQKTIGVVVVEEYPIVRWALKEALSNQVNISVLGEASSLLEANNLIRLRKPDIIVSDLKSIDGDTMQKWLNFLIENSVKALAFTEYESWNRVEAFLNAGGMGYASKRGSLDELIAAVNAVANGLRWISPRVRDANMRTGAIISPNNASLTPRESEVVSLIGKGLTSRQIADQLCVSVKTVESHRYRIFKKLKVRRCTQLASFALKNDI